MYMYKITPTSSPIGCHLSATLSILVTTNGVGREVMPNIPTALIWSKSLGNVGKHRDRDF